MNELSLPWKSRNRQTKQRLTKVQPQCVIRSHLRGETSDSELRHKLQILDLKASTGSKSLISFEGEGGERGVIPGERGTLETLTSFFSSLGTHGRPAFKDFSSHFTH